MNCETVVSEFLKEAESSSANTELNSSPHRIGDLLIQEGNFLARVSDQVRKMQAELQRMQCFLKDADRRQDETESVRNWVSEIRELAYGAENVVETFILEIASRREKGFSKKFKRYATIFIEVIKLHKLGNEIEIIQGKINDLTTSLQTYGIHQLRNESQGSTSLQQKLRRTYSHLIEEQTVGLDKDIEILVTKLCAETTSDIGEIVSICGMGGLGKTTLAKKLYHHVEVRKHFDAFAWYCVSQQFQPRDVWEGVLVKLASPSADRRDEISKMNDDEVAKELYLIQRTKKCLVVFDDIWTAEALDLLKAAFPIGKEATGGSKIVMTSRNKAVASHANRRAFIHEFQPLNEQDSWELFQRTAFSQGDYPADFKYSMDMEKLGLEIMKKCAGLPLAIIVVGGLLATKHSLSEWEEVHKNVDLHLRRSKGSDQEYSVVNGVLGLSYNELPYHLKPCFLHLGHFPEDYEIPCKTLVRMWAAEGFGSQCQHVGEGNETMEDVVERYLHDLINRSIVQVSQMGSTGRVKTCRLHDLMRDFCLLKANEENFLAITTNLNEKPNMNKVHRLGVHGNSFDIECYGRIPYLRSLLVFGHDNEPIKFRLTSNDIKMLKILSIERCWTPGKMRKEIGGFIHLRYLCIAISYEVEDVPSSIGNLRYLQTLIICNLSAIVPNVLWKLEELRHLKLGDGCKIKGYEELKLGNTRKLQTLQLSYYIVLYDVGELVKSSSQLKKLRIQLDIEQNFGPIPSGCFRSLTSLSIVTGLYDDQVINEQMLMILLRILSTCPRLLKLSYDGLSPVSWFPPNLTKLTLQNSHLYEDPMPILEKLPNLRVLRLLQLSFMGILLVCSSKGFPKLQTLRLEGLYDLEELRVDEEAMPNLSQLHIKTCPKLKMIPEGIKFITTLRRLEIIYMPKEFIDRVVRENVDGREGDDFYKVRHVPSIITQRKY